MENLEKRIEYLGMVYRRLENASNPEYIFDNETHYEMDSEQQIIGREKPRYTYSEEERERAKKELIELYSQTPDNNLKGVINRYLERSRLEAEHPIVTATLEIGVGAIVAFIGAYYISKVVEYFSR